MEHLASLITTGSLFIIEHWVSGGPLAKIAKIR
ncbi:hypothetical protein Rleg_2208 [Rhizobium leguminosarum bv. trifolii WSM1325]|uniref:Uncharacterized protein n=1 Tax=Rhizobium leguminosarum bv. trifolii (strain WSM1325) TaxID=395491 RepID=C6AZT1_RHILS|nr:hypothetical protein Rleg_2208 [Rhizobium leguminosarum bv. trifolii WSM1325]